MKRFAKIQGWVVTVGMLALAYPIGHAENQGQGSGPAGEERRELTEQEQELLRQKQAQAEIRKIISSEPDPSMMLEPIPETPEEKKKKIPAKPERPQPPLGRNVAEEGGAPAAGGAGAPGLSLGGGGNPVTSNPLGGSLGNTNAGAGGGGGGGTINPLLSLSPNGPNGKGNIKMGKLHAEAPPAPEIAVILHNKQFFPSRIRLKAGIPTKVYFTTTGERPAAIVVEQLQVQKWLAKELGDRKLASEYDKAKFEVSRELMQNKMTEITFEPRRGTYSFHDAISGAKGQIVVE